MSWVINIVWSIPIILLGQKYIMRKPLGIGSLGGPTSHPRLPSPRTDPPHRTGHRSMRPSQQDEFGPTLSSPTAIGRNNSHPFKRRGGIKTTKKIHHKSNGKGGPTPALHVPYWVRFGYFARKASVFSMPFSIAGGSAMVFICFLDLVGYAATTCGRLGCGHRIVLISRRRGRIFCLAS